MPLSKFLIICNFDLNYNPNNGIITMKSDELHRYDIRKGDVLNIETSKGKLRITYDEILEYIMKEY